MWPIARGKSFLAEIVNESKGTHAVAWLMQKMHSFGQEEKYSMRHNDFLFTLNFSDYSL